MVASVIEESSSVASLEANSEFMDKYSRQIGAYGLEAMSKLLNVKVLIVGMKGLGMEIAKNLALAGPSGITLLDDALTEIRDLGGNFFLQSSDIGTPRASAVVQKLRELNQMVDIMAHQGPITEELVLSHSVVVWCNGSQKDLLYWDNFCRENKVVFIAVGTLGVTGYIFSDFGPSFSVRDLDGKAVSTRIITHISRDEEAVVTLLGAFDEPGGQRHGLDENDHDGWVDIRDVEGMINESGRCFQDLGPFKIKTCMKNTIVEKEKDGIKIREKKSLYDPYRLILENTDTRSFTEYFNGGVLTQVKVPVTRQHRSLEDNIAHPVPEGAYGLLFTNGAKFGRAEQLHLALLALWKFESKYGHLPRVLDEAEVQEVLELAVHANEQHKCVNGALHVDEIDENVVKTMAMYASLELQPLCAYFGGVVAQEVVKITGKFSPLNQWLHLDFFEVLPETLPELEDRSPRGTRYDDLIQMFGYKFVSKQLMDGKTFMVGCGALGCEFLKNFAMIGFACGPNGSITVTDNDRIEISNLNRQFLFREHNVGEPKSSAAMRAVRTTMNPDIKVTAYEHLVAPHTEHLFPDSFWENIDVVTNALDNVKARLYVDSRCVHFEKPLLESGTLGTKCNVQVIVPHITASYADGPEDQTDEDSIPMCTLRNFPSLIEHCIEWARSLFQDCFVARFSEANKFCTDKHSYLRTIRESTLELKDPRTMRNACTKALSELKKIHILLLQSQDVTFQDCVTEAFMLFHELYRDRILQLIHNFPENHVSEAGERFWTGAKRFPQVAELDVIENEQHFNFILSAANILASNYGITPPPEKQLLPRDHPFRNPSNIQQAVSLLEVPVWKPTGEKVDLSEENNAQPEHELSGVENEISYDDSVQVELKSLLSEMEELDIEGLKLCPADFEKDQDLNFHIDFLTAASNMRAWNYRIQMTSQHQVKMIAGKIIPAIATTTSSVCGLVMVELLKVLQRKPLCAYTDSSNDLGSNSYFLSEPAPPSRAKDEYDPVQMEIVKCYPAGFTKWDKTHINIGELTLSQFLTAFKQITGLNCTLLLHSVSESEGPQRGLFLYDANAWNPRLKQIYASAMDKSLNLWISERYAPANIIHNGRSHVELQVSCCDDEDQPFKVPAVVYRWTI